MVPYETLAVCNPDDLVFGRARRPVVCGFDLTIGAGQVYPEVNFTLPAIMVSAENWSEIVAQYTEMVTGIVRRAVALQSPGIVLEFELLPAMTEQPGVGSGDYRTAAPYAAGSARPARSPLRATSYSHRHS